MTRRQFCSGVLVAETLPPETPVIIPVRLVADSAARQVWVRRFSSRIWPEAVRDFRRCGIELRTQQTTDQIRRAASGRPLFTGLNPGAVNIVLMDRIPMVWDKGRGLTGVTTRYEGCHLCVIAVQHAHPHLIPFVAVNTSVHELLHLFLQDVFERRPAGLSGQARELRIDFYATRLWLFRDGSFIRRAASEYVSRLRAGITVRPVTPSVVP